MAPEQSLGYVAVAMADTVRAKIRTIAKREGRAFARQAEIIIKIGLEEFERQEKREPDHA